MMIGQSGVTQPVRHALVALFVMIGTCIVQSSHAQEAKSAEQVYKGYCAPCHGPNGEGSRGAILATPRLVRATDEESLVNVITLGVPGTEMPPARLEPDQIRAVAKLIWGWTKAPMPQATGNIERGAQLYQSKGQCATCHAIRGEGGVYGPDLTEIGIQRGAEYLKRSLTDPSANVPENFTRYRWFTPIPDNFLLVEATTKSGAKVVGGRINEDAFSILIRDASGMVHTLRKADLKDLQKRWGKSPMPSYAHLLSGELSDIVAYLSSLRGDR